MSKLLNIGTALFPGHTHPPEGMNTIDEIWYFSDLKYIHNTSEHLMGYSIAVFQIFKFSEMRSIAFHRQVYNNNTDVAHPSPAQPFGFHLRIIREL